MLKQWSSFHSCVLLTLATLLCLLPFSGRALHIDDPLFVWAARQISQHPLDPYGFSVSWGLTWQRMSEVTKNPPLASYYIALLARVAGWSERTLHLGFLLPALGVILGSYHLARRFTRFPLLAAAATLLTSGFLVSSCSVMCDTMMLALWILATIFWLEGLEQAKPLYLFTSGLLIAACALTKYFGASLILLLLVYSWMRQRRLGNWAWYLLIPTFTLVGYQLWTRALYGHGLFSDAAEFVTVHRQQASKLVKAIMGLSFVGGCTLPGLTFAPLLWSRKRILIGGIIAALAGLAVGTGRFSQGILPQARAVRYALHQHWPLASLELALCVAGGISVLMLAISDFRKRRDADSLFLMLWVLGTLIFAAFLNWTINARSVLPLIPAAGILLARRVEEEWKTSEQPFPLNLKLILALAVSAVLSLWITQADTALANSARTAASIIHERTRNEAGTVWFEGHWGFQYYMEMYGARPVDFRNSMFNPGDIVVIPENYSETSKMPPELVATSEVVQVNMAQPATTMRWELGAGFYASWYGPLPFAVRRIPPERYHVFRLNSGVDVKQQLASTVP